MNYYLYKLTLPETGEFYYGSRKCKCNPIKDKYMGSMVTWKPDKKKLVKEIFVCDVDSYEELLECEAELIKFDISHNLNRNYNIPNNGFYCKGGFSVPQERRERISNTLKGNVPWNKGLKEDFKRPPMSEEVRLKISKSHFGIIPNQDTRNKMSLAKKGKSPYNRNISMTKEQRDKISNSKKGIPLSKESLLKREETRRINELEKYNKLSITMSNLLLDGKQKKQIISEMNISDTKYYAILKFMKETNKRKESYVVS